MIKEFKFFHGVVFSQIFHSTEDDFLIRSYPTSDNASYIINNKIGIYIKYSTKRMTPWRFSFLKRHQDEISDMQEKFEEVFVLLVCNNDGIVCLNSKELSIILNEIHEEIEWVSISRHKREKYSVNGSDGKLKFKIGASDFPEKILKCVSQNNKKGFLKFFNT